MANTTYNARQVLLTWGSTALTDGAPLTGDFCTVERTAPSAAIVGTLGGGAVAIAGNDRTGTVTVTLYASSVENADLSAALELQESDGRIISYKLLAKDYNGTEEFSSDQAFIAGPPAVAFSADGTSAPTRVWTFLCPGLKMVYGAGNAL